MALVTQNKPLYIIHFEYNMLLLLQTSTQLLQLITTEPQPQLMTHEEFGFQHWLTTSIQFPESTQQQHD